MNRCTVLRDRIFATCHEQPVLKHPDGGRASGRPGGRILSPDRTLVGHHDRWRERGISVCRNQPEFSVEYDGRTAPRVSLAIGMFRPADAIGRRPYLAFGVGVDFALAIDHAAADQPALALEDGQHVDVARTPGGMLRHTCPMDTISGIPDIVVIVFFRRSPQEPDPAQMDDRAVEDA
jgi:hypothetical protein